MYITRINGVWLRETLRLRQNLAAGAAHQLGFREMGIYRYHWPQESGESLSARLDGIIAGINRGDPVILQLPTGNGLRFDAALAERIQAYGGRLGILLHYADPLLHGGNQLRETVELYNRAEVLIVPTYAMRERLSESGVRQNMKYVVQGLCDYPTGDFFGEPAFKKVIHFMDGADVPGLRDWAHPVPLKLTDQFGKEPHQLLREFSQAGGFGLLWPRDENVRRYMELDATFSLTRYLAAGLPVIAPRGIAHQSMIRENHLGFVVNSLEEAAGAVEGMTEGAYREYARAVRAFAPPLRNGSYTQRSLLEAVQVFYRKDAGRVMIPEKPYRTGKCVFTSTELHESYGGKLALSWSFQGDTDGFLICDASGKNVLESTGNVHQHYFLLGGCEPESGFVVMSYIETLRGRLITAESEPTYLRETSSDEAPKVSVVIPAYNAEHCIARAIDMVLAQSQPDVEIVAVDDGSKDRTLEIIQWYAQRYPNVVAVHQENSGVSAARNAGVKYAGGEYIGFLDADDLICPHMIKALYRSVKKNDCDIAMTSAYQITETGYSPFIQYSLVQDTGIKADAFLQMLNAKGWGYTIVVWNKLYRAALIKNRPFPPLTLGEDCAWSPCILSYADSVCYLNDFSYAYDRRDSNTLVGSRKKMSKEELFENHRNRTLFYLKNGNPERMALLKAYAGWDLKSAGRAWQDDAYEKLWQQIQEEF